MQTMDKEVDRKGLIGGSDIAAVMGMSRWVTPLKLWAEKTGKLPGFEGSEAAELGTELEDFIARKFSRKTELKVRRDSRTFTHPEYPYMVAHIDRWILGSDAILECKTCSAFKEKEWKGDDIPVEYVLQCNWYCGILEKASCWLAVLIGGQKYLHKEMLFDADLFRRQVETAKVFWEEFVLKDQPPMAVADDNEDTLASLFPKASEMILQIEDPAKREYVNAALEHRLEVSREIDEAKEEKDRIDASLKQIIAEAQGISTEKYTVTWKNVARASVDTEKLKADGLYEQYSKKSETRTIRVSARKEGK